jgi:hypothetical protein
MRCEDERYRASRTKPERADELEAARAEARHAERVAARCSCGDHGCWACGPLMRGERYRASRTKPERKNMTKKRSRAKASLSNPKSTRRTHKDVEFAVDDASGKERIFKTFDDAAGFAVNLALSDGRAHNLDALVSSRAGARFLMGDAGVDEYDQDPDASVHARVIVKAEYVGRVS